MEKSSVRPLAIGLTILGGLLRATQHGNFAPVGALSLFAGARLRGWPAYLLPLALMAATDPFLGGYNVDTPFVYASFLLSVWIGGRLRKTENPAWIAAGALAGSVQFFLVTNFGSWLMWNLYPHTPAGLLQAYVMGIPFFWRTLASDAMYVALFFGLHAWLSRAVSPSERVVPQAA